MGTTYHIISTTYGRLILWRTYNLITFTDLIIFLIIFNFSLIYYRHLQEPSAVAFFFYSRTNERISICHAALEIDIGWNSRMHSYKVTFKRIFKKDRAYEKYIRSQT